VHQLLETLARHKFPVHIITKSDLVLRENFDVANLLLQIAFFKEFKSATPYSAWAYHKASQTIEDLNESITEISKRKAIDKLPGVGKSISRVIEEFLINAKSEKLEKEMNTW
jgi:DNA polymerase (family 10)